MAIRNPLKSKPKKDLSPAQQRRRMIIGLSARAVILFMVAAAVLYAIVSAIAGSSLFIPKSAEGVLDSVNEQKGYTWLSELTRDYSIAGQKGLYYQNTRVSTVNLEKNKMQVVFRDVFPTFVTAEEGSNRQLVSDGQQARALDSQWVESNTDKNRGQWYQINDFCNLDERENAAPSAALAAMPMIEDIKAASPEIETDKATYRGERAWLISFTPSAKIIEQMMLLGLSDLVADAYNPSEKEFILSKEERAALRDGSFTPIEGGATITRGARQMTSVYVEFRLTTTNGTSVYKILGQIVPEPEALPGQGTQEEVLQDIRPGKTNCDLLKDLNN